MNKKLVLLSTLLLMGAGTMTAQKRVTGHVTDTDGEPVVGATVRVAGTKIVTITDEQGNFTLPNVPAGAKHLDISYIGMEAQSVSVAGNVKVVMKMADNVMDEAVVVGYGTGQKLGTVVGSVKRVGSEKVNGKPAVNVADALQGQVAGVQILSSSGDVGDINSTSITVRGVGSLSASSTPLIVIDGSPVGTAALSLLNSNDIESVTVLKDASATSIYGSRAANGVLYITTKKGRRDEKAQVQVSQKMGWSQLANAVGDVLNAGELLDFQLEHDIIDVNQYKEYKLHGANTDWQDYLFRKDAPMYSTDLSIRGGSQNTSYFVSGSYLKQQGLVYKTHFKRYTLRSNLESQALKWLSVGINQSVSYTDRMYDVNSETATNSVWAPSTASLLFAPYWDPFDPESAAQNKIWGANIYNPNYYTDIQPAQLINIIYNGQGYVTLTPFKGFTVKSQLALYATDSRVHDTLLPGNPFYGNSGTAGESHARSSMWTITNTAEYKFNINSDHSFAFLLGQEGIKYTSDGFAASVNGITDNRFLTLNDGTEPQPPSYSYAKYEYLSFFGRADYNWRDKYSANITVRNDQSSRFGPTNRSAMFVSGGVMWNAKMEEFLMPVTWLDDLRVRVSVGSTGNSEIGNYAHLGLYGSTQYGNNLGWGYSQFANPDLGWEKQIQTNIGFYVSFLRRFHLDFNWYNRKTKNMLLSTPIPYTTGFSSQMRNIGEMTNRGVEIELNIDAIQRRDAYLGFRVTYGYNNNRVDKLFYGLDEWPMYESLLNYKVGKGLTFYMPLYAGVDKEDGAPMWYKKGYSGEPGYVYNEETMTKDAVVINDLYQDTGKKRFAPHNGGFGLTASWKGLTLNADFSFVLGKWMVDNAYWFLTSSENAEGGTNVHRDMLSLWQKPGDEAELPAYGYQQQFDSHLLSNASFLRLKNLTLSYDLPKVWMQRTGFIQNVRFSFQGRNVFTITKYTGVDPEVNSNLSVGSYPATRQFTLGVEVTF